MLPSHWSITRLCCVLVALGAAACSDPLGPGDVAGIYALRSAGGQSLPATVTIGSFSFVILADTLHLRPDGSGRHARISQNPGGPPQRFDIDLRFETLNGRIEITFMCPPNALCTAGPHLIARREGSGLRADEGSLVLAYRSVPWAL